MLNRSFLAVFVGTAGACLNRVHWQRSARSAADDPAVKRYSWERIVTYLTDNL